MNVNHIDTLYCYNADIVIINKNFQYSFLQTNKILMLVGFANVTGIVN